MKKLLAWLLVLACLFAHGSSLAVAETVEENIVTKRFVDVYYDYTISFNRTTKVLTVSGVKVWGLFSVANTEIQEELQQLDIMDEIEQVDIQEEITEIIGSFHHMPALKRVNLPDSLEHIATSFQYCDELQEMVFPDDIYIDTSFSNCKKLGKLRFGQRTQINCKTEVDLYGQKEEKVEGTIWKHSFSNLPALEEVLIPAFSTVSSAFHACPNLKKAIFSLRTICASPEYFTNPGHYWDDCFVDCHPDLVTYDAGNNIRSKDTAHMNVVVLQERKVYAEITDEGIRLNWKELTFMQKPYHIFRRRVGNGAGGWKEIGQTEGTTYVDTRVEAGETYEYTVSASDLHTPSFYEQPDSSLLSKYFNISLVEIKYPFKAHTTKGTVTTTEKATTSTGGTTTTTAEDDLSWYDPSLEPGQGQEDDDPVSTPGEETPSPTDPLLLVILGALGGAAVGAGVTATVFVLLKKKHSSDKVA